MSDYSDYSLIKTGIIQYYTSLLPKCYRSSFIVIDASIETRGLKIEARNTNKKIAFDDNFVRFSVVRFEIPYHKYKLLDKNRVSSFQYLASIRASTTLN